MDTLSGEGTAIQNKDSISCGSQLAVPRTGSSSTFLLFCLTVYCLSTVHCVLIDMACCLCFPVCYPSLY